MVGHRVSMLGTGLIGFFYTRTLHGSATATASTSSTPARRSGRSAFCADNDVPLDDRSRGGDRAPGDGHGRDRAAEPAARGGGRALREHGKAVLCTKPLARTAEEAKRCSTRSSAPGFRRLPRGPRLHAEDAEGGRGGAGGQIGDVLWARSRETHPGPHSAWFWDAAQAGGGPIVDLGCHCIEIIRSYMGKENRPVEVMLDGHARAPDRGRGQRDRPDPLRERGNGPVRGQLDVPRRHGPARRGRRHRGHDLDEPLPPHRLRDVHLRRRRGYVAEKAESASGWLFPVGDEVAELGYVDMFTDMFDALDEGRAPRETFYDGYVVNAIIDACYRSAESRHGSLSSSTTGAAPVSPGSPASDASTTARR